MNKWTALLMVFMLSPAIAIATPTAEETKKVVEHYRAGSEVILTDYHFCKEIATEGPNQNQCVAIVAPDSIVKGDKVYLWMNYLIPKNIRTKVSLLFSANNRPIQSQDINLKTSIQALTWVAVPTKKPGKHAINIDQEQGDDYLNVSKLSYTVSK